MEKIEKMLKLQSQYSAVFLKDFYESERDFLNDLRTYLTIHPKKANELNILKEAIINVNNKKDNVFYLNNSTLTASVYTHDFQMLLNLYLKSKEQAYIRAHKLYTANAFSVNMERFRNRYLNQELYIDMLEDIYNSFKKDEKTKKSIYVDLYGSATHVVNTDLIQSIYDSGLSTFDFAYYNHIDYGKVNSYCKGNKNNQMCIEILERKNLLEDRVLELLSKINSGEIDFYDYYKECRIPPQSLRKLASAHKMYGKEVSNFINQSAHPITLNEASALDTKLVINSVEISKDLKIKAMNSIREIGAPLTVVNYKKMLRRILKDETK